MYGSEKNGKRGNFTISHIRKNQALTYFQHIYYCDLMFTVLSRRTKSNILRRRREMKWITAVLTPVKTHSMFWYLLVNYWTMCSFVWHLYSVKDTRWWKWFGQIQIKRQEKSTATPFNRKWLKKRNSNRGKRAHGKKYDGTRCDELKFLHLPIFFLSFSFVSYLSSVRTLSTNRWIVTNCIEIKWYDVTIVKSSFPIDCPLLIKLHT